MKRFYTLTFAIVLSFTLSGQEYQVVSTNLPDAGRSQVAWGDYDNDGDLDLFISGLGQGDTRISNIFRNDEGMLNDAGAALPLMKETSACWGDYDNDGDLDLVMAGNTLNGDETYLVINDGGAFTATDAGLPGVSQGDVSFGDYDNDGDLDIFLTGKWEAILFNNDNGIFTDTEQDFGYWASSSVAWGDFDNDGDLDILLIGDSGAGARSKVFRNDGGIYAETEILLPGLMAGTADWVDYDNDGDLDIAITGYNDALEAQFLVFRNNGQAQFEQEFLGIEGVALSAVDWGDVDGDGDLDVITSGNGTGCGVIISGIYLNEYPFFSKISFNFTTAMRGSLQWADYDNDGDLDFIVSGLDYADNPFTKLYRNTDHLNTYVQNTPPSEPGLITSQVEGGSVILSWQKATDAQTAQGALSYNVRVGTTPGGCEIASCMADPQNGVRLVTDLGNMGLDTSWTFSMMDAGTYYWSVQAIDQAFCGSVFAPEGTFDVIPTGLDESTVNSANFRIFPNPFSDFIHIISEDHSMMTLTITDSNGRTVFHKEVDGSSRIDLSGYPTGMYLLRVKTAQADHVEKIFRN